jgi:ATP-dependent RNA helicase DDX49/DBP8
MAPLTMSHDPVSDDEASLSSQHSDADSKSDSIGHSSASESLDSQSSRKRRKLSPLDDDDDDEPFIPRLAVPSRTARGQPVPLTTTAGTSTSNGTVLVPTDPQTSFAALDVKPWLVGSLGSMAIKRPTGIQKLCIPEILKGRDCIGGSRTGSGKTMAFAVPMLQKWAEDPFGIFALVLTPTRYEPSGTPIEAQG